MPLFSPLGFGQGVRRSMGSIAAILGPLWASSTFSINLYITFGVILALLLLVLVRHCLAHSHSSQLGWSVVLSQTAPGTPSTYVMVVRCIHMWPDCTSHIIAELLVYCSSTWSVRLTSMNIWQRYLVYVNELRSLCGERLWLSFLSLQMNLLDPHSFVFPEPQRTHCSDYQNAIALPFMIHCEIIFTYHRYSQMYILYIQFPYFMYMYSYIYMTVYMHIVSTYCIEFQAILCKLGEPLAHGATVLGWCQIDMH